MKLSQIVDDIHNDIEKNSYSKIQNFLDADIFNDIRLFLEKKSTEIQNKNFSIDSSNETQLFNKILQDSKFVELYNGILNKSGIRKCNEQYYVMGLREGQNKHKTILYHFDAYYLTILFPIIIPDIKHNGKLHLFPKWRKIQKFEIFNFIQKFLIQNKISRKLLNFKYFRQILNMQEINLDINYIYFFKGYTTVHGVGKHLKDLRSTAVFHFHNPHKDGFINEYIKNKHKKDREKILKKINS